MGTENKSDRARNRVITIFVKSLGPSVWVAKGVKGSQIFFELFLYSKKSSPVHSKFGPFGTGSHREGELADFV